MHELQKHVVEEFGSPLVQEMYIKKAEEGLWGSEELLIKKYFKKKSAVLDIGCGTGRTTISLFKMGYKVTGLDITPQMIANAKKTAQRKKLKIKYVLGDATDLPYNDSTFDAALFSNNGWTQIPGKANRAQALKNVFRVLKPRGYFIFTTHIRKMQGFTFFWIKQWVKQYILKPLGFGIEEIDFGDRFFDRETTGTQFSSRQYIHIPSMGEVKKAVHTAGFELVFIARGNEISSKDSNPSPMAYVCQKQFD
jgi:ubiquinone/menaquinone biosynthesis C-methylase UbiE